MYLGCPWYSRTLCIEVLGVYMGESTWDVLGIPGYYVLRIGGSIWGEVPWMSLVSWDTMY